MSNSSEIKLNVNDKQVNAYLANGGGAGILLLHAWWGLKPFFKQFCDRLATQGFTVLAPDMRDGQIATTIDEAKALMEKSNGEFVGDVVLAAKEHLRGMVSGKIGLVGFSMGAGWALIVAAKMMQYMNLPVKPESVVLFYEGLIDGFVYDGERAPEARSLSCYPVGLVVAGHVGGVDFAGGNIEGCDQRRGSVTNIFELSACRPSWGDRAGPMFGAFGLDTGFLVDRQDHRVCGR